MTFCDGGLEAGLPKVFALLFGVLSWPKSSQTLPLQAFIYALCQAGVRPNITKLLDWGLSRTMTETGQMGVQDWANPQAAGRTK